MCPAVALLYVLELPWLEARGPVEGCDAASLTLSFISLHCSAPAGQLMVADALQGLSCGQRSSHFMRSELPCSALQLLAYDASDGLLGLRF